MLVTVIIKAVQLYIDGLGNRDFSSCTDNCVCILSVDCASRDCNPGIPYPGIPVHFSNPEIPGLSWLNPGISGLKKNVLLPLLTATFATLITVNGQCRLQTSQQSDPHPSTVQLRLPIRYIYQATTGICNVHIGLSMLLTYLLCRQLLLNLRPISSRRQPYLQY